MLQLMSAPNPSLSVCWCPPTPLSTANDTLPTRLILFSGYVTAPCSHMSTNHMASLCCVLLSSLILPLQTTGDPFLNPPRRGNGNAVQAGFRPLEQSPVAFARSPSRGPPRKRRFQTPVGGIRVGALSECLCFFASWPSRRLRFRPYLWALGLGLGWV